MSFLHFLLPIILYSAPAKTIEGSWASVNQGSKIAWIFVGGFYSASQYDPAAKTFTGTWGGSYTIDGNSITLKEEFNTLNPEKIGIPQTGTIRLKSMELSLMIEERSYSMERLDDGTPGQLPGAWWITGRMVDGQVRSITPGARRTMKILSGTRFQWIAYNVETKEFFGTGGGTYTTKDGKYAETIEFFSRDNSRVGSILTFDFNMEEGRWRHRGLSSKGEPIDEYWSKRN